MKIMVTGATSGMGEAFARLVRREGHAVIAIGRDEKKLKQLELELGAEVHRADLTVQEDRNRISDRIRQAPPDILVNAAGVGLLGAAADHDVSDEVDQAAVDGLAVLQFTLEAVKAWSEQGTHGTVLNVASLMSQLAAPNSANYGALKAYVNRLSQALDAEMHKQGIRVLSTLPGPVLTEWLKRAGGREQYETAKSPVPPVTAQFAAERWWKQIQSGKRVDVFDWHVRGLDLLFRLLPRGVKQKIALQVSESFRE